MKEYLHSFDRKMVEKGFQGSELDDAPLEVFELIAANEANPARVDLDQTLQLLASGTRKMLVNIAVEDICRATTEAARLGNNMLVLTVFQSSIGFMRLKGLDDDSLSQCIRAVDTSLAASGLHFTYDLLPQGGSKGYSIDYLLGGRQPAFHHSDFHHKPRILIRIKWADRL